MALVEVVVELNECMKLLWWSIPPKRKERRAKVTHLK